MSADNRERYAADPEKKRRERREYTAKNREMVNRKAAERYRADPAASAERNRSAYWRDPEKRRAAARAARKTPEGKRRMDAYNAKVRVEKRDYYLAYTSEWFKRNPGYRSEREAVRRTRALSLPCEPYTAQDVIDRDGFSCWVNRCAVGGKLSNGARDWHIDHLIPLAAVGYPGHPGTVLANLAIACYRCNAWKKARVLPAAIARYEANLLADTAREAKCAS